MKAKFGIFGFVLALISILFVMFAGVPNHIAVDTHIAAPLDGQVLSLHTGATFAGIKSALQQTPGTFIMMKDRLTIFVWSVQDGWAFVAIDPRTKTGIDTAAKIANGGNFVNCKTIDDLMKFLTKNGWNRATPDQVSGAIWVGMMEISSWLNDAASSLPTFVFIPANAQSDFLDNLGVYEVIDS